MAAAAGASVAPPYITNSLSLVRARALGSHTRDDERRRRRRRESGQLVPRNCVRVYAPHSPQRISYQWLVVRLADINVEPRAVVVILFVPITIFGFRNQRSQQQQWLRTLPRRTDWSDFTVPRAHRPLRPAYFAERGRLTPSAKPEAGRARQLRTAAATSGGLRAL